MEPKGSIEKSFTLDRQKMRELIIYISSKNKDAPEFGSTVLNKMLLHADIWAYISLGKPITGDIYVRREFGPTPKSLLPIREELENKGWLKVVDAKRFSHTQHRPIALRMAKKEVFTKDELEVIDFVISALQGKSGKELSDMTHRELIWKHWREDEEISYEAFFISDINPISQEDMRWAVSVANESRFSRTA